MEDLVFISGHKNPDTDSICAAIGYAHLKRKRGVQAVPVRLGDISLETRFVLDYFGVPEPIFLDTVKRQVSDLDMDEVPGISPQITVKSAWNIMRKNNVKVLPVVDDAGKLLGVVTLSNITQKFMDAMDDSTLAASQTSLDNIAETINGRVLVRTREFRSTGRIHVAASNLVDLRAVLDPGDILITGQRQDVLEAAIAAQAGLIIHTCAEEPAEAITEAARNAGTAIIGTLSDTYTTARLINQSTPIRHVMTHEDLVVFEENDLIDDIRERMLKTRYRSYPVVDTNQHVKGFISRYHLISPRQKKVILVDHNERSQTVNGIEQAEILEIIDHHRLGDITTGNPIYFKNEPVGSTSTIIAILYEEAGLRPTRAIAGILCAAILSDTLQFVSPTCTHRDRLMAERLADNAGIDIAEFAREMFKAGSTLKGRRPIDIVRSDFKDYRLGKLRFGIGQVYTQDMETLAELRTEMLDHMEDICIREGFDSVMVLVTDVTRKGSELILTGPASEIVAQAFGKTIRDNSLFLEGVVSRKKQILPKLAQVVE